MATFYNASSLASHQRARAQKVYTSIHIVHEAVIGDIKAQAIRMTSGNIPTKTLAIWGHPYARRHVSRGRRPTHVVLTTPIPINRQTGKLQRSLRVFRRHVGKQTIWQLQFTDPKAKFILAPDGTRYMIARGFWQELQKYAKKTMHPRLLNAYRLAQR